MAKPIKDVVRFIAAAGDAYDDGDSISNMKLQKLLYYLQGFHLAAFSEGLFSEETEAWEHGPVVPPVWKDFRHLGREPIRILDPNYEVGFEDMQRGLMNNVYRVYGQYSAWKLREMTHREPPWINARKKGDENGDYEIKGEEMGDFFKTRLRKRG